MKRPVVLILIALTALVLFAGLVYAVLVAAQVSEPAPTTIRGPTPRRLWATAVAVLGLGSVIVGAVALRRSSTGVGQGPRGAIVALVLGSIAAINGGLNLAVAKGGLGSGNGVVGGAAALVMGLTALALGSLVLARGRRPGRTRTIQATNKPS